MKHEEGAALSTAKVVGCKTYTCLHPAAQVQVQRGRLKQHTHLHDSPSLPSFFPPNRCFRQWLGQTVDAFHVHGSA
jgi:hypothetical protein